MKIRTLLAASGCAFAFAANAHAGSMNAKFTYQFNINPGPAAQFSQVYLYIGGGIATKGAPFNQIVAEAQNSQMGYLRSVGFIDALNNKSISGSFVASTFSPNTTQVPATQIAEDAAVLLIGAFNPNDGFDTHNGVAIGYDNLAGTSVANAHAPWTSTSLPMFAPSSPTAGSVVQDDNFESESGLYSLLTSGNKPAIQSGLASAMSLLAAPITNSDSDEGYVIPRYNQLAAANSPSLAAKFHYDQTLTARPIRMVKFSDATDAGGGDVTISAPQDLTPGDFDGDDLVNATDIDLLLTATPGTVPNVTGLYDVNNDDHVILDRGAPGSDADYWVHTLAHTEYGDANLDGKVDFDDLVILAQHYNQTNAGWALGSFDGDGIVSFPDLVTLAQHYGAGAMLTSADGSFSPDFLADWQLARSLAPEPATLSVSLLGLMAFRRRR